MPLHPGLHHLRSAHQNWKYTVPCSASQAHQKEATKHATAHYEVICNNILIMAHVLAKRYPHARALMVLGGKMH